MASSLEFIDKISSVDEDYQTGDLSVYPAGKDSYYTLYEVRNNAKTKLTQTFPYSSRVLYVEDTSLFPDTGLLVVGGGEVIFYTSKTLSTFTGLKRGFSGSRQNQWMIGSEVLGAVLAEPHNAIKDSIIKIETNLGLESFPEETSLHGLLKQLETRYLAPKPIFRAYPTRGKPPLTVQFQNFSQGSPIRFLWDFGDGGTSVELSPSYTYFNEGSFTVKLTMITSLGAQGIVSKDNYVVVNNEINDAFFYVTPLVGNVNSTVFNFVDQSEGEVVSRYWVFDDGSTDSVLDPDIHTTTHIYSIAGTYNPSLIVVYADGSLKKLNLIDDIIVN